MESCVSLGLERKVKEAEQDNKAHQLWRSPVCSAVCFLAGRRKCCRMVILPPWQTAQLMNRRNEINHKTKPKKHKRLASSLRSTQILSPGYVCRSTHLYYKAWLVASCPGKKMTLRGGSGSFPVCQTRSLLSHHCRSRQYHPDLLGPKQAQFQSWSESSFETLSLTHVVVSFTEKWEQKHLWNIKASIQCLEEREKSQLHIYWVVKVLFWWSHASLNKKKRRGVRIAKTHGNLPGPEILLNCKLRTTAGRWEKNSPPRMVDLKY